MEIKRISDVLKERYGTKVYKLALSNGCTCPNRDGTVGLGGCTFCSEGGSGEFAADFLPVREQIAQARARVDAKMPAGSCPEERRYIAYFQSFSGTYGDAGRLRSLYLEAVSQPEIVGLSIGTRPDCLGPEVLEMLAELNRIKPVWIELGLQTIHEETARRINRGFELGVFEEAYRNLKAIGVTVIVHVILGLPGETREMILDTVRYLAGLDPVLNGIKLHLLHVLRGTRLAKEYEAGAFEVMSLEEYCGIVVDCLKLLPPETIVHRITGDGPKRLLIAPLWSGDKKRVLNTLNRAIREA